MAHMGEKRNAQKGKHEGNRPFGRPSLRWENNIKMLLQKIVWKGVDWIDLFQDRGTVLNTGINLHVPYDVWNFLTS